MRPLVAAALCATLILGCGTGSSARRDTTTCPDGDCSSEENATTSYRKVQRDPDAEPPEPEVDASTFESFDPGVEAARLSGDQAAEALASIDGTPEPVASFRGDFASTEGDELFLVFADSVVVYGVDGERIARRKMTTIRPETVRAVRLVDDRLEVVVTRAPAPDAKRAEDELVVLRVIGRAVAEVFVAAGPDRVEFVRRHEQKAIRVDEGEPKVHLWNEWEGVFRVPQRAPTAPK